MLICIEHFYLILIVALYIHCELLQVLIYLIQINNKIRWVRGGGGGWGGGGGVPEPFFPLQALDMLTLK